MSSLKGVLLDVDGTLVDSNDAHARAWVRAFSQNGLAVPYDKVRPLIGMGGDKLMPQVSGMDAESEKGKAISAARQSIFLNEYLPTLRPFPRVRELLEAFRGLGLRLVVASSAKKRELDGLLRVCEAADLVEAATSSDDADNSKPDPDIVHAALRQASLTAGEVLFLGDTPYDVQAGQKAGVRVVAVRCGGWGDEGLAGAVAVYDGPADLLGRLDASPFAIRQ